MVRPNQEKKKMGEPVTDLSCDGDTEEAMEVGLEIAKAMALHCSLWNA